jgi:replicative DNA helicase
MEDRKSLEKLIIKKLICNPDTLSKKIYSLSPLDFTTNSYKVLIQAFQKNQDLINSYVPSIEFFNILLRPIVTNSEERNKLSTILSNLAQSDVPDDDIEVLIKELKSYRICDEMTNIIKSTLNYINPDTVDIAYEHLVENLLKLPQNVSLNEIVKSKIIEVHESLKERLGMYFDEGKKKYPAYIKAFDAVMGGFTPTEFVVVSAPSGHGKSNLLLWMAENYVEHGNNVMFITLEMSYEEVLNRYHAMHTGVSVTDISRKRIPERILGEYLIKLIASSKERESRTAFIKECILNKLHKNVDTEKLLKIANNYKNRPSKMYIIDIMENATPLKIEQEYKKLLNNGVNIDMIFVDFINVMESDIPVKDRVRELGIIAKDLKRLAKKTKTVVFTAAQLSSERAREEGLTADSIKYSKAIVENADWVMGFNRTEEDINLQQVKLKLIKHRHSSGATALLQVDFSTMQVKDLGFADDSPIPKGYDKEGNRIEMVSMDEEKPYSLLEEYTEIIESLGEEPQIKPQENKQEEQHIDSDIEMLNKIKEIFPDSKISLLLKPNKLFERPKFDNDYDDDEEF